MKLSKRHNRGGILQLNMTPMIDCVFLLLIFFMTVTQVSAVNKTQLDLPEQKGTEDQSEAMITINVDAGGNIIISGSEMPLVQAATLVAETIAQKGENPDRVNILIRVDRKAKSRTANELVKALELLKVTDVRFGVEQP